MNLTRIADPKPTGADAQPVAHPFPSPVNIVITLSGLNFKRCT